MKYIIKPTSQFKKDLKKMEKQHKDLSLLTEIINNLANAVPLPEKNKDHELSGNFKGCRECHIQPDWLLIYEIESCHKLHKKTVTIGVFTSFVTVYFFTCKQ